MKIKNRVTGDIIEVPCVIEGPDWELVEEQQEPATEEKPRKAKTRK